MRIEGDAPRLPRIPTMFFPVNGSILPSAMPAGHTSPPNVYNRRGGLNSSVLGDPNRAPITPVLAALLARLFFQVIRALRILFHRNIQHRRIKLHERSIHGSMLFLAGVKITFPLQPLTDHYGF